jgi:hypothetical protein
VLSLHFCDLKEQLSERAPVRRVFDARAMLGVRLTAELAVARTPPSAIEKMLQFLVEFAAHTKFYEKRGTGFRFLALRIAVSRRFRRPGESSQRKRHSTILVRLKRVEKCAPRKMRKTRQTIFSKIFLALRLVSPCSKTVHL